MFRERDTERPAIECNVPSVICPASEAHPRPMPVRTSITLTRPPPGRPPLPRKGRANTS